MTNFYGMFFADGAGFATVDIVVIAFILILGVVGMLKGFTKLFFSLFGTLIVIVGSVLLAKTVGSWLMGPFGHTVSDPIANAIAGLDDGESLQIFTQAQNWADAGVRQAYVPVALTRIGIPEAIATLLAATGIFNGMFEGFGTAVLSEVLPQSIASIAMTVIAFLILLVVLSVVAFIVRRILIRLTSFKLFGALNRVLGFVLGLLEAYLIVSIILTVIAYLPMDFLSGLREQIQQSVVTKFLFDYNWIASWLLSGIF